jgi:hypothetical protein
MNIAWRSLKLKPHLCEVVDPGELQEGGHAVAKTAYDKPIQRRGIMNLNSIELT